MEQSRRGSRQAMPSDLMEQLLAEARYARERYDLYKSRVYGGTRPTSLARLRELERATEYAEARLRHAQTGDKAQEAPV
jgi:predicted alternative tryptophan synthase beta-subunit